MPVRLHANDFRDFARFRWRHHAARLQHHTGTGFGRIVSDLISTGAGRQRSVSQKSQIKSIDDGTGKPVGVARFGNLDGGCKCSN